MITTARFLKKLFDLREGAEEKRVIIDNVKDDADFSSARFWTLVCAIVIASIGLNMNSIPVIIGAMLISPIMGPLVSMGLALAIYDWGLLRRSFRNFLILTAIGVTISAIYFILSPINNAQSELLSRITPTIFDVLIAIFGGAAGFIGISRARYNNVIPGVAIATALIPPLCTVGYGIGTLQFNFVIGAFYLFIINSIFICLSALLVAKYLKLPKREYPDLMKRLQVKRIITGIIVVVVTPAVYLAYTFVLQNNFYQNAERYINTVFTDQGEVVIYRNVIYSRKDKYIELALLSSQFSEIDLTTFESLLPDFGLAGTRLIIRQNDGLVDQREWQTMLEHFSNNQADFEHLKNIILQQQTNSADAKQLFIEVAALYPNVTSLTIGDRYPESPAGHLLITVGLTEDSQGELEAGIENLLNWLKVRLNTDLIFLQTFFEVETVNNELESQ